MASILGPDGRPIRTSTLTTEQARPAVGSILSPTRHSVADGLTPATLGRIMKQADAGNIEAYLVMAEEMEEREPHYASVLSTRKLGVAGAPVTVEAASDSAHDIAIAEDVEQLVGRAEFEGLVIDLMDAVAKGFACIEIIWDRSLNQWEPKAYEFRPQRHFVFDRDTMSTPRLRSQQNPEEGIELQPFKWLVHKPKLRSGVPIRTGLARTAAVCFAAKRFTIVDWLAYMDSFGPIKLGKYPTSAAEHKKALLAAVKQLGTDSAAVIPSEMEVEILESKSFGSGGVIFESTARYWDAQTSKVVLGQTMTSDDGASLSQSVTHERVRFDIKDADARSVSATITRDLVRAYVDLNYGPQKAYPKVRIDTEEPEDTKSLMDVVTSFVALGGRVEESTIRDRLGLPEPEDGADLLVPAAVAIAKATPAPEPEAPTDGPPVDNKQEKPDEEDPTKEANSRARFATETQGTKDVVDELTDEALDDWRPLVEGNVGELLRRIQDAATFEEARALLDELASDQGQVLDIGALVVALSRKNFTMRGVGDATDKTEL
jgi:phage gp29-like protein